MNPSGGVWVFWPDEDTLLVYSTHEAAREAAEAFHASFPKHSTRLRWATQDDQDYGWDLELPHRYQLIQRVPFADGKFPGVKR